jgi:hypothetical protein
MDKIINLDKYITDCEELFGVVYNKREVWRLIDLIWLKFSNRQLNKIGEEFDVEDVSYKNGNQQIILFNFQLIEMDEKYITDEETGEEYLDTAYYTIKYRGYGI